MNQWASVKAEHLLQCVWVLPEQLNAWTEEKEWIFKEEGFFNIMFSDSSTPLGLPGLKAASILIGTAP